jgi:hypothetical protein
MSTLAQFGTCILAEGATRENPMLYGAGVIGFPEGIEIMHEMVCDPGADPVTVARHLKERIDPWWERLCLPTLCTLGDFVVGSDRAICVRGGDDPEPRTMWLHKLSRDLAYIDAGIQIAHAEDWLKAVAAAHEQQMDRYRRSRQEGTDFHRAYERILFNENPATFDYYRAVGLERG